MNANVEPIQFSSVVLNVTEDGVAWTSNRLDFKCGLKKKKTYVRKRLRELAYTPYTRSTGANMSTSRCSRAWTGPRLRDGCTTWYWSSRAAQGEHAPVNCWYIKIQFLPEHKQQFYFRPLSSLQAQTHYGALKQPPLLLPRFTLHALSSSAQQPSKYQPQVAKVSSAKLLHVDPTGWPGQAWRIFQEGGVTPSFPENTWEFRFTFESVIRTKHQNFSVKRFFFFSFLLLHSLQEEGSKQPSNSFLSLNVATRRSVK